jgi:hypothetical protein
MKRKCLAVGIILLFIGVTVAPSINSSIVKTEHTRRSYVIDNSPVVFPFINYNSYVIITYNTAYVNQTEFIPNNAYMIPANISYKIDVPYWLLHSIFFSRVVLFQMLKNWFLFGSIITPNMVINLSIENVPTWADIYPFPQNILGDQTNEWTIIPFTVVLIIHNQAPPGPFSFTLTAEALAHHRINGFLTSITIPITVQ